MYLRPDLLEMVMAWRQRDEAIESNRPRKS